jgi:hypothetical protein
VTTSYLPLEAQQLEYKESFILLHLSAALVATREFCDPEKVSRVDEKRGADYAITENGIKS